jgi:ABC-type polysaccharide/polyol phosphate export permease
VQLLVFAVVFGVIFRVQPPPLGADPDRGVFVAFLFTGMVTWTLFSQILIRSMGTLRGSSDLLKKAYFPPWAPLLGGSIVQMIQAGLEFVVLVGMFIVIGNVGITWFLAIPILFSVVLFAQGIGLMLAVLNARFGDVEMIVTTMIAALYFLTPILYPMSLVESISPDAARVIQMNPMTWYVEAMHDVMYSLKSPGLVTLVVLFLVGFAVFVLGLAVFNRYSSRVRMWL